MAKEINIKALNAYKKIVIALNEAGLSWASANIVVCDALSNYEDNHYFDGSNK